MNMATPHLAYFYRIKYANLIYHKCMLLCNTIGNLIYPVEYPICYVIFRNYQLVLVIVHNTMLIVVILEIQIVQCSVCNYMSLLWQKQHKPSNLFEEKDLVVIICSLVFSFTHVLKGMQTSVLTWKESIGMPLCHWGGQLIGGKCQRLALFLLHFNQKHLKATDKGWWTFWSFSELVWSFSAAS